MEYVFSCLRLRTHAALCECHVGGNQRVEVVAYHDHVEELSLRVDAEGQCRVGRRRKYVCHRSHLQEVGSVAAACALGVVGMDSASVDCSDCVFHKASLIESIGVDGHLHVVAVGVFHTCADCRGCGSPVLVDLEAHCACHYLLFERVLHGGIALCEEAHVDRQAFR